MSSLVAGVSNIDVKSLQSMIYAGVTEKTVLHRAKWENKDVFIKTLIPEKIQKGDVDNFLYEIRIMEGFKQSSYVVQLLGIVPLHGKYCAIVMEDAGKDLARFLSEKKQSLDWSLKFRLAWQGAEGLAYIHQLGVDHGDVKSDNILVDKKGNVKFCDFGFSFFESDPGGQLIQAESKGKTLCSPPWVQPERVTGVFKKYNKQCDVFSYGIVMWEIATCEPPHQQAESYNDVRKKLLKKEHEPLPEDCPEDYRNWTEKARAFDPKDRSTSPELALGLKDAIARIHLAFENKNIDDNDKHI